VQLIVDSLSVERGGRLILDNVTFTVTAGEALILTGANGAGKTTLLRALAGHIPALSGSVRLDSSDAVASIGEQAHAIGHTNAVKTTLTVAENLVFWQAFLGGTGGIETALKAFALEALQDYPAAYLSAGQKRRTGLARLLTARRPLWLLDEPTASLDAASSALVSAAINEHLASGGIGVIATHLPLDLKNSRELKLKRTLPATSGAAA
jgi:heme exporter protein A